MLAWLLGKDAGDAVRHALTAAETIVGSDLTLVECERVLIRASIAGDLSEVVKTDLQLRLAAAAAAWNLLRLAPEIVERARRPFPEEPIRILDALHIASALYGRSVIPDLEILSLDDRVRRVGHALGFAVQPR